MIVVGILTVIAILVYFSLAAYFNCENKQDDVVTNKFRERWEVQMAKDRIAIKSIWKGRQIGSQPQQVTVPTTLGERLPIDCTFKANENGTGF